jgi:hypothetical protein
MCQALGFVFVRIGRLAQSDKLLVLSLGFRLCALGVGLRFGELVPKVLELYFLIPVFFFVFVCEGRVSISRIFSSTMVSIRQNQSEPQARSGDHRSNGCEGTQRAHVKTTVQWQPSQPTRSPQTRFAPDN